MKILNTLSGGLDGTVLLYEQLSQGHEVWCVTVDYGQKNRAEIACAKRTCEKLKVRHDIVELCRIKNLFLHCALTDGKGGNIVPNRNGVILNITAAMALSAGYDAVSIASNKDDDADFPDCRPLYLHALNTAFRLGEMKVQALFPYVDKTKVEIVAIGRRLNVPFEDTMSCYEGTNCGKCAACKLREKALK